MNQIKRKVVCSVAAVMMLITGGVATVSDGSQPVGTVVIDGKNVGELRVSPAGLALIGDAEGCRHDPYRCPSGLITNGIGNTHGVPDAIISLEQVAKDWVRNIQHSEQCLFDSAPSLSLSQGHVDAFTSFIFNVGCTRFRHNRDGSETGIYRWIKAGNYGAACGELNRWVYGGGKKLPGLVTRRQQETEVCRGIHS